jgi:long-chain acyl-CoA synthetase
MTNKTTDPDFGISIDVIGIIGLNREEWIVTDLACNLIDVTSVPLYETLGPEMVNIILKETEMSTIFGSDVCLLNVLKSSKGHESNLKRVVCFDGPNQELIELTQSMNIELRYYHSLLKEFEKFEEIDSSQNKLDTIFTISYTSGTSGNSKGVMLTNENFLSAFTNIL